MIEHHVGRDLKDQQILSWQKYVETGILLCPFHSFPQTSGSDHYRKGISLGLALYCLLCSYGLIPKYFSFLVGPLLMFFKFYSALKEQGVLCKFYVPTPFIGLQLKFFLPVDQIAFYRTLIYVFKLQANQYPGFFLLVVGFFIFSFPTLCGSKFFDYSYGLLLSLCLIHIALCKHSGHSKMWKCFWTVFCP